MFLLYLHKLNQAFSILPNYKALFFDLVNFTQDAIHRIKEAFNKEFDEVYSKKEQEISKYKEKNKRIAKIIKDLTLDEEVTDPNMSVVEKPELLLEVLDSEVMRTLVKAVDCSVLW